MLKTFFTFPGSAPEFILSQSNQAFCCPCQSQLRAADKRSLLLELEHHGMLQAMPLLGCCRTQPRLELFHAPVTQSRAPTVHQELADLARPEQGTGMLSAIVSLPSRRAVPTSLLYSSTHSGWMFPSGIQHLHTWLWSTGKGMLPTPIQDTGSHMFQSPSAISSFDVSVPVVPGMARTWPQGLFSCL